MPQTMTITIRPVKTIADCEPIEAITLAAWGAGLERCCPGSSADYTGQEQRCCTAGVGQ